MTNYVDTSATEQSLVHAARELKAQFRLLEKVRWYHPRVQLARKMRPTFGPQSPTPDNDWALNIEDCMINERRDERIPGGLAVMVADALEHAGHNPPTQPTGIKLCDLVEQFAWRIAERFPAAPDLTDLMIEQTAFVSKAISKRYPDTKETTMTRRMSATDIVQQLAVKGTATTVAAVRGWARRGHISAEPLSNGRSGYRLDECLLYVAKITHQKTPHDQRPHTNVL